MLHPIICVWLYLDLPVFVFSSVYAKDHGPPESNSLCQHTWPAVHLAVLGACLLTRQVSQPIRAVATQPIRLVCPCLRLFNQIWIFLAPES